MEEFDFNNDNIGTSISDLKNKKDSKRKTENEDFLRNDFLKNELNIKNKSKKKKNNKMSKFIKKIENELENFESVNSIDINEPLPVNSTNNMIEKQQVSKKKEEPVIIEKKEESNSNFLFNIMNSEYKNYIFIVLIFMIINHKIIVTSIDNYILSSKPNNSDFVNLLIRTVIFGILLYLLHKY